MRDLATIIYQNQKAAEKYRQEQAAKKKEEEKAKKTS